MTGYTLLFLYAGSIIWQDGVFTMRYFQAIPEYLYFALRFFFLPFMILVVGKVLFELLAFNFFDLAPVQQASAIDKTSVAVKLNEMKARLLWIACVLVYVLITMGFGVFIWDTLRNSIAKSALRVFVFLAMTIVTVEAYYLLNVAPSESPIKSIFSFTFDSLSSSGLFTINQLFLIHITLDIINFIALLIVPFGIISGCCIMHKIPITLYKDAGYYLDRSQQLKKLITGGSAVMVIGIIHMQLWLNWPLIFLDESKELAQLKEVVQLVWYVNIGGLAIH